MNYKEFGYFECLVLKYIGEDQTIQSFCRIGSPKEIRSTVFKLRKFWNTHESTAESCRTHWNLMSDREFRSFKCLILKHRRGDQILQLFCRISSPQEIRSTVFKLRKFSKTHKSTAESCRAHWNLMTDEEFGSFKYLIFK